MRGSGGEERCCASEDRSRESEDRGARSKVYVISFSYRLSWGRLNLLLRGTDRTGHSQMVFTARPVHKL